MLSMTLVAASWITRTAATAALPGTTLQHYAGAVWRWHQAVIMIISEEQHS